MPRGKAITPIQESIIVDLYKKGITIKEIMTQTGIRSQQTIYRLLDDNKVPRRPKLNGVPKSFYIEKDVIDILKEQPNTSQYVNNAVRYYHKKK